MRDPAVAGKFYPQDPEELTDTVKKYIETAEKGKEKVKAIIVPHAGYVFSGKVAGLTYSGIEVPERVIIIGPNHTGRGEPVSVMRKGFWSLPGKKVEIAEKLASKILKNSRYAKEDKSAHLAEHSIEVQLPFLLYKNPELQFVPICLGVSNDNVECLEELGEAIAQAVKTTPSDVLLVASTDMSHFVSKDRAREYDNMAIEKIKKMDYKGLLKTVVDNRISMCGAGPVATVIKAALELDASEIRFVHYNTSARITGDNNRVVGYAGMRIK